MCLIHLLYLWKNVAMLSATFQEKFLLSATCLCGVVQGVCGGWSYTMISMMMALSFTNSIGNGSNCYVGNNYRANFQLEDYENHKNLCTMKISMLTVTV